jgi:hypothetical protein
VQQNEIDLGDTERRGEPIGEPAELEQGGTPKQAALNS